TWELKMLPLEEIKAEVAHNEAAVPPASAAPEANAAATNRNTPPAAGNRPNGFQRTQVNESSNTATPQSRDDPPPASSAFANVSQDELNQRAADGLLINGSVNNGAASPFAQLGAFGNNRRGARSLYNGGVGLIIDNSSLDARAFSLTGQDTRKPD